MRMYFDDDTAWRQLRDHGFVATLRPGRQKRTDKEEETAVQIWRNGKDTGLRATKRFIRVIYASDSLDPLREWQHASGFADAPEWAHAATKMSGSHKRWRLFLVRLVKEE